jgi:hypothetical protein
MQTSRLFTSHRALDVARVLQALLFFAAFLPAAAERQVEISKLEAQAHLVKKVEPVYPAFARAAGVDGVVHVRIGIGLNGRVGALLGSSGPPSLFKAAEDAVLSYSYMPFEVNGHAAYVQTTVDVVFKLRRHKKIPPPPRLSRENFSGSDYYRQLPPALRQWLTSHLPPDREQVCESSEPSCTSARSTAPNDGVLEQVDVFEIRVSDKSNHLFLIEWNINCGGTGNCPEELVEESSRAVRSILTTIGSGFYVHPSSDSPYPDILAASHISAREAGIQGYVNAGGQWGQLYCGCIEINEDQSERDEVRVCR